LNFSFSGLKTAFLYFVRDKKKENPLFLEENMADVCASIQYRIVTVLLNKVKKAVEETGINQVAIAGGVSANSGLRNALLDAEKKWGWTVFIPKFEYCTDNAAMISIAGYYKYLQGDFVGQDVSPLARWSI
jgi:N6-L-threonylcarbamoyladenine synthase